MAIQKTNQQLTIGAFCAFMITDLPRKGKGKMQSLEIHIFDKFAMYLRKSRADLELEALGEGETLAKHRQMLLALASRYDIHSNQITVYQEIVSGESIEDRPEMQRLLDDVYARKYKGVLVVEVERLARGNTKDQGEVAEAFQLTNTKIITPAKIYDPTDEFDQEYFEFGLFMSRREYKTIRRRLEAGKRQSALVGNYLLPQRIFGYNIERKDKQNRYLVINEEESKYVHMIYDWFTEDKRTCGWIAKQLTLMGVPLVRNGKEWEASNIIDILKNPHYIGMITWGSRKTVKTKDPATGKTKKCRVKVDPAEIPRIQGKHKAIISEEQFQKAQRRFSEKAIPVNHGSELVNPLAGILHCAACGKSMSWWLDTKGTRKIRYVHRGSNICKVKSLPAADVLNGVIEALKVYLDDFESKSRENGNASDRLRHLEMIQSMEAELSKMERKRKKLFDDYEDEVYTRDEFIERKQKYARDIGNLTEEIRLAKENLPQAIDCSERITTIHKLIDTIADENLSAAEKNDFLKGYIEDIEYDVVDYGMRKGGKPILKVILK